ncbi:MAG: TetR/AcrR family transcriptional regulator [Acidimicrobiia bacterium]|nr:TetR/AcrR family transcriptional regulator [Acidimicrobiia bacterium]
MNDVTADDGPTSLREENRQRGRQRIVDAAVQLVAERGAVDFTMPEVADRSGVALRTLYRHFPRRQDLVDELATVADQVDALPPPKSLDDLGDWMVAAWRNLLAVEALLRAQHQGPAGDAVRRTRIPRHRAVTRALVETARPDLDTADRDDLVDIALLVASSTAMFEFIDVIGIDVERGARLSADVIATMIRSR